MPSVPSDPVERYKALQARAKRAEEAIQQNAKNLAVAEDRLQSVKAEAKKEFGTDDPAALTKISADSLAEANAALEAADTMLTTYGF